MPNLTRRKTMKLLAAAAATAPSLGRLLAETAGAAPVISSTVTRGASRPIPTALYGLNSGDDIARYVDDPAFMKTLARLAPGIFRYPGGNGANWFDWSTGLPLANPSVPMAKSTPNFTGAPFTLPILKRVLEQGKSQPTLVLNLLTGSLEPQMAALKQAKSLGIPIDRIELGNEYYLDGIENGRSPYNGVFPTAAVYGKIAMQYARALKAEFPECRIGVPIISHEAKSERGANWNDLLMKTVDSSIDAIIPHIYHDPPPQFFGHKGAPIGDSPLKTPGAPQTLFALAFDQGPLDMARKCVDKTSRPIWVTETNLRDFVGSVANTWTHGLFVPLDLMNLLTLPRLEQGIIHALLGGTMYGTIFHPGQRKDSFPNSDVKFEGNALSATGYGCMMVFKAARGKTSASPLSFSNNAAQKTLDGKQVPSLYGWAFGDSTALMLNLSGETHTAKIADAHLAASPYFQMSGNPTEFIGTPAKLTTSQGASSSVVPLAPYSMTLIGS